MIAAGPREAVEAALVSGQVPVEQAAPRMQPSTLRLPSSYASGGESPGQPWPVVSHRSVQDTYTHGRDWDRSVSWGPDATGETYLILVVLVAGSV